MVSVLFCHWCPCQPDFKSKTQKDNSMSLCLSLPRLSASDDSGRGDHDAAVPVSVAARVRPHPSCLSPAFSGRSRSLPDGAAVQGGNRPLQAGAASGGQSLPLGLLSWNALLIFVWIPAGKCYAWCWEASLVPWRLFASRSEVVVEVSAVLLGPLLNLMSAANYTSKCFCFLLGHWRFLCFPYISDFTRSPYQCCALINRGLKNISFGNDLYETGSQLRLLDSINLSLSPHCWWEACPVLPALSHPWMSPRVPG